VPISFPPLTLSSGTLARTQLVVTAGTSGLTVSVQYTDDSGVTWLPVRNGTGIATGVGNAATIYDYEAPPLGTRSYRAMVQTALGVPSAWSSNATITNNTMTTFWLKDPTVGLSGIQLKVESGSLSTHFPEALTEHQPLGSPYPYVVGDVVGFEDGVVTAWTMSATDESALVALLKSQRTLLLQSPDGRQWYIRITSPRPTDAPLGVGGLSRLHTISWRGQPMP
jgi:hypothetical protein